MRKLLLAAIAVAFALPAYAQSAPVKYDSAATTNSTLVRPGNALVDLLVATNTTATVYYLKLFDSSTAPTCGSGVPVFKIAVPASGQVVVPVSNLGMRFQAGVGFCLTALPVADQELLEETEVTADGNATVVALRHLVDLTRKLKRDYHEAYRA